MYEVGFHAANLDNLDLRRTILEVKLCNQEPTIQNTCLRNKEVPRWVDIQNEALEQRLEWLKKERDDMVDRLVSQQKQTAGIRRMLEETTTNLHKAREKNHQFRQRSCSMQSDKRALETEDRGLKLQKIDTGRAQVRAEAQTVAMRKKAMESTRATVTAANDRERDVRQEMELRLQNCCVEREADAQWRIGALQRAVSHETDLREHSLDIKSALKGEHMALLAQIHHTQLELRDEQAQLHDAKLKSAVQKAEIRIENVSVERGNNYRELRYQQERAEQLQEQVEKLRISSLRVPSDHRDYDEQLQQSLTDSRYDLDRKTDANLQLHATLVSSVREMRFKDFLIRWRWRILRNILNNKQILLSRFIETLTMRNEELILLKAERICLSASPKISTAIL